MTDYPSSLATWGLGVFKNALGRFRFYSNKLRIELGRHLNIEKENRVCYYCLISKDIVIVENEYHVFFYRFFYNLLKSENIIVIRKITKFISVLMKLTDNNTETKFIAVQYRLLYL